MYSQRPRATSTRRAAEASDDYHDYHGAVLYAQDVLDEAWQYKKGRQRNGGGLALRFLTALGGRPAMFSDNRDFMESTLDSVVRVSEREGETTRQRQTDRQTERFCCSV